MATERGRYALDAVCITPEGVTATDGRTLTCLPHLPGAKVPSEPFMVDGETWKYARKVTKRAGKATIERTPAGELKATTTEDGKRITREAVDGVQGSYPNARAVCEPATKFQKGTLVVALDIDYLRRALDELAAAMDNPDLWEEKRAVLLFVQPEANPKDSHNAGDVTITEQPVVLVAQPQLHASEKKVTPGAALVMPIDQNADTVKLAIDSNPLRLASTGVTAHNMAGQEQKAPKAKA